MQVKKKLAKKNLRKGIGLAVWCCQLPGAGALAPLWLRKPTGVLGSKCDMFRGLPLHQAGKSLSILCRIVFVLLAGDSIPKVIQINEYNMFGEYIAVTKIPSWVSHLSSRMVERIKLRLGYSSVLTLLCRVIHATSRAFSLRHFQTQVHKDRHLDMYLGTPMNTVYFAEVQLPEKGGCLQAFGLSGKGAKL